MNKQPSIKSRVVFAVFCTVTVVVLHVISRYNYLLFHVLIELFSIIVACGIFMLVWNARRVMDNNYLLMVGIAYLFVALLDLVHTLAYKGMGVFLGYGSNLATQFWIAARYLQSGSLLAAPFAIERKIKAAWILSFYAILTAMIFIATFALDIFPACYIEGEGLTGFKKSSEYIIAAILTGSATMLWFKRSRFDRRVLRFLIASILVAVFSELSFTLYKDVYGPANQIGHFLKLASFYLLYKAALETGIREPYAVLLHNLNQSNEQLENTIESLTHPFYVVNVNDYSITTANSAAYKYSGSHGPVKCYVLSHKRTEPCGTKEHPCPLEIVKRTKKPTTVEHVHYDKDGNEHHVEIYAYPVFDRQKNVKEVIEYCVDVTEHKLAEQQMENLAKFPSEDPNPVLRIAEDGIILYANAAGLELLKNWGCEVNGHAPQSWHQYVLRILSSGSSETLEHASGLKVFSLTITPVVTAGYVNVYGTDVTDRKRVEDDLRKYREHLEELVHERTGELTDANKQLLMEIEQRKTLEREILNISEQEQRRLGQELHDSLGQQLTGISFMAKVLERKLTAKSLNEASAAAEIAKLVKDATDQARGLAKGLHPVDLDSGSLISSLQELAASTQHLFGIRCAFKYDKPIKMSSNETAVHLYRIAQEAVTNAIKHGQTKNVQIQLQHINDNAVMTIENDGRDFPRKYQASGTGMGLQIMDHRVDLIGGTLTIRRGHKGGTIVNCTFPLDNC